MNFLLIYDNHNYAFAKVIEEFKNNIIVEMVESTNQKKIRHNQIIIRLNTLDINRFMSDVLLLKQTIDVVIFAELIEDYDKKISIFELTKLYFNDNYTNTELLSLLFALSENNNIFTGDDFGNFSKDSIEVVENKKKVKEKLLIAKLEYEEFYQSLIKLEKPNFGSIDIERIIHKADKNSNIYKSLYDAAKFLKLDIVELCYKVRLIDNLADLFLKEFLNNNFSGAIKYIASNTLVKQNLIIEDNSNIIKAFSIDDENTSEIDDAFSVQELNDGYLIGIHISAPAIDKNLETMVCDNISTIYYPNGKITMLPNEMIKQYSLDQGRCIAVVSIYFEVDINFEISNYYSKLEKIFIASNLRVEELDSVIDTDIDFAYKRELDILYSFALALEKKRGKPSVNNISLDYSFKIDANEKIIIKPRYRGNKVDKTVSELMILANCSWGRLLTNSFIPAIYRVKQPNTPVKMTTQADSHTGLNVSYYTWATSPLRRASDYINQRQIIAMLLNSKDYYQATDSILLQVVESFDSTYSKYITFQNKMEKYWSLKYLLQENITEIEAIFLYKTKVQLVGVPIELDVQGLIKPKEKGSKIKIKILDINLATINFNYKILD
jgi:exoribonuclease-2